MNNRQKILKMVEIAIFIAVIIVMKLTGLSSIPVGPLVMTLTMVPIAIGAMLLGPVAGAILGCVYGFMSFYDAITGASGMTGFFFQTSPVHTFILCVVTRTLVGFLTGLLFLVFKKIDRKKIWCYFAGGLMAPMLNTILFMGYIVLFFYHTEFIQGLVESKGASNALMFVILLVGVQGLIEWATGLVIGGSVAKGVAAALKRDK
ncbi:MAG: ECF transporter S component [Saccharofermentans sp.]|nr:ECF transporter S component [Saccharofermentans sp.]